MEIGRRLVYNNKTGKVLYDFGEMSGDVMSRPIIEDISIIDIPYGEHSDMFLKLAKGLDSVTVNSDLTLTFDCCATPMTAEEELIMVKQQLATAQEQLVTLNSPIEEVI